MSQSLETWPQSKFQETPFQETVTRYISHAKAESPRTCLLALKNVGFWGAHPAPACTRAFGWRGSKLAIERLKEALGEIKTVARHDPETTADGAVLLMERLWPALRAVDSSSGALWRATNKTVHKLR
jgi:hypothetical protein